MGMFGQTASQIVFGGMRKLIQIKDLFKTKRTIQARWANASYFKSISNEGSIKTATGEATQKTLFSALEKELRKRDVLSPAAGDMIWDR